MSKMDIAEFKRVLEIGLGRPIMHLQKYDAAPYRDVILDVCSYNTVYDRQVEGSRLDYLLEVVSFIGDESSLKERILAAIPSKDNYDADHLCDFAIHYAESGDDRFRKALYTQFEADIVVGYISGADRLYELDGPSVLPFIAERLGEVILSGRAIQGLSSSYWLYDRGDENLALLTQSTIHKSLLT